MSKKKSPQKLSLLAICLDQKQNLDDLKKRFSYVDEIILAGFEFNEIFISSSIKNNITLIDLSTNEIPIHDLAQNDAILFIDLDENINNNLKDEIVNIAENGFVRKAYYVKRDFVFLNKNIKQGTIENNTEIRLFDKRFCEFKDNLPLIGNVIYKGKAGILTNKIQNLSYKDFDSYNLKQTVYNHIVAKMLFRKGKKPVYFKFFLNPFVFFINQYFFKFGFIDKKEGFILAYIHSFGKLKRQIQLWLLTKKMN